MAADGRNGSARKGTIASHPLFPAIVALWFAALLGLGSLILPEALFMQIVGPDAASPAVRGAVALAATLAGAALGYVLARKVTSGTAAQPDEPAARRMDGTKRPISAIEELGPEGLDEPVTGYGDVPRAEPFAGRRRPLSLTDESAPSEFLERVPVPGGEAESEPETRLSSDEDALELTDVEEEPADAAEVSQRADDAPFGSAGLSHDPASTMWPHFPAAGSDSATVLAPPSLRAFDEPAASPATPAHAVADETPELPASPSVAEEAEPVAVRPAFGMPQPVLAPIEPTAPEPAASNLSERPLSDLGMVELVERFAISLQRSAASTRPPATPETVEIDDEAPAAAQNWTAAFPNAFDPFGDEDDDHEELDLAHSFSLPTASIPAPAHGEGDSVDDMNDDAPDQFASLLAMRGRIGAEREVFRVEDADTHTVSGIEPVVVFPGQEPRNQQAPDAAAEPLRGAARAAPFADPRGGSPAPASAPDAMATETALREALAKLQKLSGAA